MPHRLRAALCTAGLFFGFLAFASALRAGVDPIKIRALRQQAEFHEQQAEWDKACLVYESILRLDRSLPEIQERYQSGLRRYWQVRRHGDPSYRKEVLGLDYAQALRLYTMIRNTLIDNALDKNTVDPGQLLRKGIEEFDNALTDPYLVRQYLAAVNPRELRAFRDLLKDAWARAEKLTKQQAVKQVRELALAAQRALHVNTSMVVMEFACGACYGLDEYTLYLTPNQLRELCASLHGEYVGVGLGLRLQNNKIVISEVFPYSPAAEIDDPPVTKDDVVISIDKKPLLAVNVEAAQDLLDGPAGTSVELEIYSRTTGSRSLTLRRRAVFIPSVSHQMKSDQLGYLHIACFQDTTVQEVDDALAALAKEGMKSLILDLRGNGGGVFEAAIDVARRFLATGVIAATQNSDPRFSTVYQARNPSALVVGLVILIDGDTASAAEVLAGALKDNKRARLVGQTSFGKGCTQCVLKLPSSASGMSGGGIRLTVARFFSPDGLPYSGRGVVPHVMVDTAFMNSMSEVDPQMDAAIMEAQRLLDAAP